jgi:hypothetical protein
MVTFLGVIVAVFRAVFMGKQALVLENVALRQQLGVYLRKEKRPPETQTLGKGILGVYVPDMGWLEIETRYC